MRKTSANVPLHSSSWQILFLLPSRMIKALFLDGDKDPQGNAVLYIMYIKEELAISLLIQGSKFWII